MCLLNTFIGHHIAKEVFRQCYEQLVSILPIIIADILPKLISERIISIDDKEEIKNMPRPKDKASFILDNIGRSLEAGAKENFYVLLDIMEECGNDDVRDIVIKMRRMLMTGELLENDSVCVRACVSVCVCAYKHVYYYIKHDVTLANVSSNSC